MFLSYNSKHRVNLCGINKSLNVLFQSFGFSFVLCVSVMYCTLIEWRSFDRPVECFHHDGLRSRHAYDLNSAEHHLGPSSPPCNHNLQRLNAAQNKKYKHMNGFSLVDSASGDVKA